MINDLSELKKLLQLCRKQGVTEIELGSTKIKLGELPQYIAVQPAENIEDQIDDTVGLQDGFEGLDPMAFYSARKVAQQ